MLVDRNISIVVNKKEIEFFEKSLEEITNLNPDANEYACLRAIMLFNSRLDKDGGGSPSSPGSETKKLQNVAAVALLEEQSMLMLNEVSPAV